MANDKDITNSTSEMHRLDRLTSITTEGIEVKWAPEHGDPSEPYP